MHATMADTDPRDGCSNRFPDILSISMITHDEILSADSKGTLLSTIAAIPYDEEDYLTGALVELHNEGKFDILKAFRSDQLNAISGDSFFSLQRVFCQTLPQIGCPVAIAAATCKVLFEKAGTDLAAGLVYDAFGEWLKLCRRRVDEGLALIRHDMDVDTGITRHVLLAGAAYDVTKFSEVALDLSHERQPHIRQDALFALGRMALEDEGRILPRVTERLDQEIESPSADRDAAIAIDAALHLLDRFGEKLVGVVEPLLVKACKIRAPNTRHAIAVGLLHRRKNYTDAMVDASFSAIQHVDKHAPGMIEAIDSILYRSDLDGDRERVLRFLRNLLSHSDDAIDIDTLDGFRNKLNNEPVGLLGWYVVSLLLTGDLRLSVAANRLLPYDDAPAGLDIDLTPFALNPAWVFFLAQKILGYCLVNRASASALLLSCLRAVSDDESHQLESLILNYFLFNYPESIQWFEAAISPNDPARTSVKRLSSALEAYLEELHRTGPCGAFRPSERERQLQAYRQADVLRTVQKQAEKRSILSQLAHRFNLLYGTGSIFYVHKGEGCDPHRQEMSLASFHQTIEIPRLDAINPVDLQYAIYRFRSEAPPK